MSELSYRIESKLRNRHLNKRDLLIMISSIATAFLLFLITWKALSQALRNRFQTSYITIFADILSIITVIFICKNTNLSINNLKLTIVNPKKILIETLSINLISGLVLLSFKVFLLKVNPAFFPTNISFIDFNQIDFTDIFYPITCLIQEILIRNFFQLNIKKMFKSYKHCGLISIIITSFFFGLCHFAYGIRYMVAATLYIFIFGFLYEKQNTIWGVTFSHFFLGELGTLFRLLC